METVQTPTVPEKRKSQDEPKNVPGKLTKGKSLESKKSKEVLKELRQDARQAIKEKAQ